MSLKKLLRFSEYQLQFLSFGLSFVTQFILVDKSNEAASIIVISGTVGSIVISLSMLGTANFYLRASRCSSKSEFNNASVIFILVSLFSVVILIVVQTALSLSLYVFLLIFSRQIYQFIDTISRAYLVTRRFLIKRILAMIFIIPMIFLFNEYQAIVALSAINIVIGIEIAIKVVKRKLQLSHFNAKFSKQSFKEISTNGFSGQVINFVLNSNLAQFAITSSSNVGVIYLVLQAFNAGTSITSRVFFLRAIKDKSGLFRRYIKFTIYIYFLFIIIVLLFQSNFYANDTRNFIIISLLLGLCHIISYYLIILNNYRLITLITILFFFAVPFTFINLLSFSIILIYYLFCATLFIFLMGCVCEKQSKI